MSPSDVFFGGVVLTMLAWLIIPRINRSISATDGAKARRREFLEFASDIKTHISESDDPEVWVNIFKDNAPRLKAEFVKISSELVGSDKTRIQAAVDGVMRFSAMSHADVYQNGQEVLDALNKFPDT